ncbi:MAG: UbiA family prenyltransferase [bacterium]
MTNLPDLRAALALMRPRQWPILSAQLAVGCLLGMPTGRADQPGDWAVLASAWFCWVVLLNGATLAFNSAYDRDTGPVAYLPDPPPPPGWLAGASLAAMTCGVLIGWATVAPGFGLVLAGCLVLSVLYSHPRSRWKSRPGLDLLVNVVGYGAGTTAAGLLAGKAAWGAGQGLGTADVLYVAGFGLLFGSFYPQTQIYQAAQDAARGDRTLTTALGPRPALRLALVLGLAAGAAFVAAASLHGRPGRPYLLVAALIAWCGHVLWWERRQERLDVPAQERAMYRALKLWAVVDAALVAGLFLG